MRYFGKKYCWNEWDCSGRFFVELRFVYPCAIYLKQIESIVVGPPSIGGLFEADSEKSFENLVVSI